MTDGDERADPGRSDDDGGDATWGPGEETPDVAPDRRTPVTQQVGRVVLVLVAVLFTVFALANAQHVDFSWVFGETEVVEQGGERSSGGVRLIVLLLVAFVAGALVASLASWQRARGRRQARDD